MNDPVGTHMGNLTKEFDSVAQDRSVWSLIKNHLDSMVEQAIQRTETHLKYNNTLTYNFQSFKLRLEQLLRNPLKNVAPGHSESQHSHTIHREVEHAVEGAVDEAINELNMTDVPASNISLAAIRNRLVFTLDSEIELDVFNKVFTNSSSDEMEQGADFFHSLPAKDETMFVALVCMAVIIPVVFMTFLVFFFYRRNNETKERRQEMLLEDQPEFSMDEYNPEDRQPTLKIEVPVLDLSLLKLE